MPTDIYAEDSLQLLEAECAKLDAAVDAFAEEMKKKLRAKAAQGFGGWDNPAYLQMVLGKLMLRTARVYARDFEQAVDVANLAMMCLRQSRKLWQQNKELPGGPNAITPPKL